MKEYINYCTPEQTARAFRLGAACEIKHDYGDNGCGDGETWSDGHFLIIPTTQQIIGWLEEEKNIVIDIDFFRDRGYQPYIDYKDLSSKEFEIDYYSKESTPYYKTRKEAELAAINTALDYLENNK